MNPDPAVDDLQSALDTLYRVSGSGFPSTGYAAVAMTSYHGNENAQFIWSGFDIWSWQRSQCIALVDGVLQGAWGLSRDPVVRGSYTTAPEPRVGSVPTAYRPGKPPAIPVTRTR